MDQVAEADATEFPVIARLETTADTTAVDDSDSPLAHALRRRRRERETPMPVTAGHDSSL